MSRQKAQIKTPVHSGGAFSRNENSSLCHFTPRKKIALQLAVSLWVAGGLLGAPGIAAAQDTVVAQNVSGYVIGNHNSTALDTTTEDPNNNTVTVNAGVTVSRGVIGSQKDNGNEDDVTNNTVILNGTARNVYGGYSLWKGEANKNKVTISGGTVNGNVVGGRSALNQVVENTVEISAGTINDSVYGGYADNSGDLNANANATDNTVTISGGTINGNVIGGQLIQGGVAQNNTVNILTQLAVQGLYGGIGTTSSGNTLNLAAKGVTATEVSYFQNLNFYLPTNMTKSDIMLTVNGTANVDGATVGVMAQGRLKNLTIDDKVTLLHADTLNGTVSQTTAITVPKSIATVNTYEFNVTSDDNNIYATITNEQESTEAQANTKSMVETRVASTTILNAGADMLARQGFQQAANAIAQAAESGDGQSTAGSLTPFAAIGTGSLRAESGSYVDTKSWALNVGFAKEINNRQGKLLFGPLVEYGRGSYDSYLDNGTHGEGNSSYWGLGLMARQTNHDGLYYEGSLRGGKVKADYSGNVNTLNVNYDISSNYIAAHLGLGKVSKISADNQLDCYVKYFYSRQSGDNVTVHAAGVPDEVYNFDSVSSHRLRLGTRLTHKLNKQSSLYGGVAYQYEFDGDARATYNGNSTPSPSVKGGSGMFELGWQVKPDASPLTLDLGLTAWAGKQRGLTGQLGMNWKF